METLFIGGSADGKVIRVPYDSDSYAFAPDIEVQRFEDYKPDLPLRCEVYRAAYLSGTKGRRYRVMVHDVEADVIQALIDGYKGN